MGAEPPAGGKPRRTRASPQRLLSPKQLRLVRCQFWYAELNAHRCFRRELTALCRRLRPFQRSPGDGSVSRAMPFADLADFVTRWYLGHEGSRDVLASVPADAASEARLQLGPRSAIVNVLWQWDEVLGDDGTPTLVPRPPMIVPQQLAPFIYDPSGLPGSAFPTSRRERAAYLKARWEETKADIDRQAAAIEARLRLLGHEILPARYRHAPGMRRQAKRLYDASVARRSWQQITDGETPPAADRDTVQKSVEAWARDLGIVLPPGVGTRSGATRGESSSQPPKIP